MPHLELNEGAAFYSLLNVNEYFLLKEVSSAPCVLDECAVEGAMESQ